MAEIKLSELRPAGSELLQDSESFLNELSDRELENVVGGNGEGNITIYIKPSLIPDPPIIIKPVATVVSTVIDLY
ncbi:MAG: hypothetical protein QNJ53_01240 [Pleurocapsa sp. MO_192.B19]|nr:hypothetical protein [Pleurocapsa sp. MO_192.B19]